MTFEEWQSSDDAPHMLKTLYQEQTDFFHTQVPQLHRYVLACCWKHQYLIPQPAIREGLEAAESWIRGEVTDDELDSLNWNVEAQAFHLDYAKDQDELDDIRGLVASIDELAELKFEEARILLRDAAYFADGAMVYPICRPLPWRKGLFKSSLLCPELLREHLKPTF